MANVTVNIGIGRGRTADVYLPESQRYTDPVEDRPFRIGSFFEWVAAALGVALLMWILLVPFQRVLGPGVEAALVDAPTTLPPGVGPGATSVPVMLLLDGREIRQGDLHSRLVQVLPEKLVSAPILRSPAEFGERQTRTYLLNGTKFYVVCERSESGGPMRVSGIYLQ
jgi:hypothetical protein